MWILEWEHGKAQLNKHGELKGSIKHSFLQEFKSLAVTEKFQWEYTQRDNCLLVDEILIPPPK